MYRGLAPGKEDRPEPSDCARGLTKLDTIVRYHLVHLVILQTRLTSFATRLPSQHPCVPIQQIQVLKLGWYRKPFEQHNRHFLTASFINRFSCLPIKYNFTAQNSLQPSLADYQSFV